MYIWTKFPFLDLDLKIYVPGQIGTLQGTFSDPPNGYELHSWHVQGSEIQACWKPKPVEPVESKQGEPTPFGQLALAHATRMIEGWVRKHVE